VNTPTSRFSYRRDRRTGRVSRTAYLAESVCVCEPLEDRKLMSATWTTLAQLPTDSAPRATAADLAGNIYVLSNGPSETLQERTLGSSAFTTIYPTNVAPYPIAIATDKAGNLFVATISTNSLTPPQTLQIYERREGGTTFSPIGSPVADHFTVGIFECTMATDTTGDVYVAANTVVTTTVKGATTTTMYGNVIKLAPDATSPTGFNQSTIYRAANIEIHSIAAAGSGASASVVLMAVNENPSTSAWLTINSRDGGASWAQPQSYVFDPSNITVANAIAADSAGVFYVVGYGRKSTTTTTLTGYDRKHQPIYTTTSVLTADWIVRKSIDGGITWTTIDDYVMSPAPRNSASAIAIDPSGVLYVGGDATNASGVLDSVVRTNAGGTWSTTLVKPAGSGEGDVRGYCMMIADSFGNIFAAGVGTSPIVHELPAAPSLLTASPDSLLPSSQINLTWTNAAGSDETGFAIYRSSDGGATFALVATVGAGVTAYSDSGLTAGTTYSYYVVTLLNSDGTSSPSNTATATTALA
jgi:hypothetical protein